MDHIYQHMHINNFGSLAIVVRGKLHCIMIRLLPTTLNTCTSCLTSSLRSWPEEKTPPLADKMITLKSQSTLWSRFDLIAVSIDRERAFLMKNKRLDLASTRFNGSFFPPFPNCLGEGPITLLLWKSFYKMLFNSIFQNVKVTLLCISNMPTMPYAACPEKWSFHSGGGGEGGQGRGGTQPPFSEFSGSTRNFLVKILGIYIYSLIFTERL